MEPLTRDATGPSFISGRGGGTHAHTFTHTSIPHVCKTQCGRGDARIARALPQRYRSCVCVKTLPDRPSSQAEAEALVDLTLCNALARAPRGGLRASAFDTYLPRPAVLSVFVAHTLHSEFFFIVAPYSPRSALHCGEGSSFSFKARLFYRRAPSTASTSSTQSTRMPRRKRSGPAGIMPFCRILKEVIITRALIIN